MSKLYGSTFSEQASRKQDCRTSKVRNLSEFIQFYAYQGPRAGCNSGYLRGCISAGGVKVARKTWSIRNQRPLRTKSFFFVSVLGISEFVMMEYMNTQPKNTICLWYEKDAQAAAEFYASIFPESSVGKVFYAPSDFPDGREGDVLTVEFTVFGIPCIGLNGGPTFKQSEAFSFQIATDDQVETDRYWNAIVGNGGKESACGWCKDRWGVSWQITPRVLTDALASGGAEAKRAFDAMMTMQKIDIAAIEAAVRG
jgi:predicted 3-demethylubiquinone-9 3-methyltransferase (glyoxalase superfamily)